MNKKSRNFKQYFNPTKNQKFFSWASKGISTPVGILIVLLVAVAAGVLIEQFWSEEEAHPASMPIGGEREENLIILRGREIDDKLEVRVVMENSVDSLVSKEEFKPLLIKNLKDKDSLKVVERYLNMEGYYYWAMTPVELRPPEVRFFDIAPYKKAVMITATGFADDSMEGEQKRIDLIYREGVWEIDWIGRRWRCWPHRGPTEWTSTSNCF